MLPAERGITCDAWGTRCLEYPEAGEPRPYGKCGPDSYNAEQKSTLSVVCRVMYGKFFGTRGSAF